MKMKQNQATLNPFEKQVFPELESGIQVNTKDVKI